MQEEVRAIVAAVEAVEVASICRLGRCTSLLSLLLPKVLVASLEPLRGRSQSWGPPHEELPKW